MKINTIKVGGVVYDVVEKPFIDIGGDRNYQGCTRYPHTSIEILADLSDERKNEVICHELTHAIFYEAGYEEQEEDVINRIGKVIHQVMRDNDFEFF